MSNVSKEKKHRDPYRFQKRVMSVVAIVLCLSLVLSLVAGLPSYDDVGVGVGGGGVVFFSSRRRHTSCLSDLSSDVCSSDLIMILKMQIGQMDIGILTPLNPIDKFLMEDRKSVV